MHSVQRRLPSKKPVTPVHRGSAHDMRSDALVRRRRKPVQAQQGPWLPLVERRQNLGSSNLPNKHLLSNTNIGINKEKKENWQKQHLMEELVNGEPQLSQSLGSVVAIRELMPEHLVKDVAVKLRRFPEGLHGPSRECLSQNLGRQACDGFLLHTAHREFSRCQRSS